MKARRPTTTLDRILAASYSAPRVSGVTRLVSMPGTKIEDGTIVGEEKIAKESISGDLLVEGTVEADRLNVTELSAIAADLGTITAGSLDAVTITGTTITGGLVRTAASGARVEIDSAGIRGINAALAEKFNFDTTTGILTATAVISSETGSVIDTEHLAGQIAETQIEDDAISTPKLQANSVTAAEINVATLSAISANIGEVTAGTLTGVTFQTSALNPRVYFDAEGFYATDAEGGLVLDIPSDASTAEFAGHIEASGIDLPTIGLGEPEQDSRIQWVPNGGFSNDSPTAVMFCASPSSEVHNLKLMSLVPSNGGESPGFSGSNLSIFTRSGSGTSHLHASARNGETNASVEIIRSNGASDFLQLPSTAKREIGRGTAKVEIKSGTDASTTTTVNHGLGEAPTAVVATPIGTASGTVLSPRVTEFTSTTFKLSFDSDVDFGVTSEIEFSWIAMT